MDWTSCSGLRFAGMDFGVNDDHSAIERPELSWSDRLKATIQVCLNHLSCISVETELINVDCPWQICEGFYYLHLLTDDAVIKCITLILVWLALVRGMISQALKLIRRGRPEKCERLQMSHESK